MILVISHPADDHAVAVIEQLDHLGAESVLFDLADFPSRASLALSYGGEAPAAFTLSTGGTRVNLGDGHVAWWRRPRPFEIDAAVADPAEHAFAYTECHEAVAGLWEAIDARWVNPPALDEAAAKKSYQLRVAAEAGLRIPRTLITNDVDAARAFVAAAGVERTVYKAFSATEQAWRETRVLRPAETALLDRVALAPVIFQEFVPAEVDLRVTIAGDCIFPAAIYSQETGYAVDFRLELDTVRIEPATLPPDVVSGLRRLMRRLGIVYGAVDLRRTPEGEHVFLEVNPSGQWLFVEERTGQPITRAIAELLAGHDRDERSRFRVPRSTFHVPGSASEIRRPATNCEQRGTWNLEPGTRNLEPGTLLPERRR